MKAKSESEVAQSRPNLSDPMDCSLPGSSAHGIFQARVLEWGAFKLDQIRLLIVASGKKEKREKMDRWAPLLTLQVGIPGWSGG